MLADLLVMVLVGYIIYRFVYGFVVPLMRASRQVRQQFRNMQGSSHDFNGYDGPQNASGAQRPNGTQASPTSKRGFKPPAEDYIDFEEIK